MEKVCTIRRNLISGFKSPATQLLLRSLIFLVQLSSRHMLPVPISPVLPCFSGLETYTLAVGGVLIVEDNAIEYSTTSQEDISISVSSEAAANDKVVYNLVALRKSTGEKITTQRQFSACDQLDLFCRSAIGKENHHLRTSLPAFPPKYLKQVFTARLHTCALSHLSLGIAALFFLRFQLCDHTAPEFIERRTDELSRYFNKLVQVRCRCTARLLCPLEHMVRSCHIGH
jgi:hypothetical protein